MAWRRMSENMALSILVGSGLVGNGKRGEELREGHDGTELADLSFSPSSQSVRSSVSVSVCPGS